MTPILFIDRDGTLIEEPADFQVDRLDKVRFVRDCIPALLRLRDAGYAFVMVTNQDGLGTPSFPLEAFEGPQAWMLQVLESQGIVFRDILVDRSFPADNLPTRKPNIESSWFSVGKPLDQVFDFAGKTERSSKIVRGPERQNAERRFRSHQLPRHLPHRPVTSRHQDEIGRFSQRCFPFGRFGRAICNLVPAFL